MKTSTTNLIKALAIAAAVTTIAFTAEGAAANGKRPVYVIAHRCNSIGDIEAALSRGANAIECDVRYGKPLIGRTDWAVTHDWTPTSAKTEMDLWLNAANNAAKKYGQQFALIIFDIKTSDATYAGSIANLHRRARSRLPADLNLLFSHADWDGRRGFDEIHKQLGRHDGMAIDEDNYPLRVQAYFRDTLRVSNYWYGNGTFVAGSPSASQTSEQTVREAGLMRDRGEGIKKTYIWTLARESSIEVCVRDHKADGVMVNEGTIGAAVRIVNKHARMAVRSDDAFAVHYVDALNPGYIGTFGKTPPDYRPIFVYAIRRNGDLYWYRKDTNASKWDGPKRVGSGWNMYKDVISTGGNRFYAVKPGGKLFWYQHEGFNDGSVKWNSRSASQVGEGWNFKRIFSGSDGIVYAIRQDEKLFWLRDVGFQSGHPQWQKDVQIGEGWGNVKDVFSTGKGNIYVVQPDGKLLLYVHTGYLTGAATWSGPRQVGEGWAHFKQIIPAGDGVIMARRDDGKLFWYKHLGAQLTAGSGGRKRDSIANTKALTLKISDSWEGPIEIGQGWQDFVKVVALIPEMSAPGPR